MINELIGCYVLHNEAGIGVDTSACKTCRYRFSNEIGRRRSF